MVSCDCVGHLFISGNIHPIHVVVSQASRIFPVRMMSGWGEGRGKYVWPGFHFSLPEFVQMNQRAAVPNVA